ncbi:hypothetical protein SteCoe_32936 [Stentor coeruleus]|uniref:GAR domain-containing protein n=1 Tax=Stentor coeruleus TaxID=5963 RepID=A0A1R2AXZ4_9CILI|nr:hypothetical protein SteCoe_32936 [Stentor coeruleus]
MECPLYIQLLIEEVKIQSHDLSSTKLNLRIDSITKVYQYPYRDIFFQISSKYCQPEIKISFLSQKIIAEGSYQINNYKASEKFRIQLIGNKDPIGYAIITLNLLEHLNKEICRHCSLATDILTHNSKSAKKLADYENRLAEKNLGLEIGLKFLDVKNKIENEDLKYIKNLLLGAHEKIKAQELYQCISNSSNRSSHKTSNAVNLDYTKIIATLEQEISNQNKTIDSMHIENKNYIDLYLKEKSRNRSVLEEIESLKLENNVLKGEMIKIRTNHRKASCVNSTLEDVVECKKQAEQELAKIRELYRKSIEEFANAGKSYEDTISKLAQEKDSLEAVKDKFQLQIKELKIQNDSLNSLVLVLRSEISEKEAKIKVLESFNKESMAEHLIKESITSLYKQIDGDKQRFNEFSRLMRKEKNDMLQKTLNQAEEIKKLKEKIDSLETCLHQSQLKLDDTTAKLNTMKQKVIISRIELDISGEMREAKTQIVEYDTTVSKILDFIVKYILDLSAKYLFQQRLITRMFKYITDKDCEIILIRHKLLHEQGGISVYTPEKNDNIDIAMADYINTRPNFLEVGFIRVDQGVYLFGTKIVKVKLQNNRLIMCLGGGFMSIDEFITIFTPQELEKLAERKKFDLINEMKIAVNDSLSFVSEGASSPNDSTGKKIRIGGNLIDKLKNELIQNAPKSGVSRENSRSSISSPLVFHQSMRSSARKPSMPTKN